MTKFITIINKLLPRIKFVHSVFAEPVTVKALLSRSMQLLRVRGR